MKFSILREPNTESFNKLLIDHLENQIDKTLSGMVDEVFQYGQVQQESYMKLTGLNRLVKFVSEISGLEKEQMIHVCLLCKGIEEVGFMDYRIKDSVIFEKIVEDMLHFIRLFR